MDANTSGTVKAWISRLEAAMGITIGATEQGAFALRTQGGAPVVIEPVAGQMGLILSGQIGTVDDTTPTPLLLALLAANLVPGMVAPSSIGLQPADHTLVVRLLWTPSEAGWTQDGFFNVLSAFGEQVDALAAAIASRSIEQLLPSKAPAPDAAPAQGPAHFA